MLNYGPLKSLLLSDDMSEIMVNSWDHIFVEHNGCIVQTAVKFIDAREFHDLIFAILLNDKKDYSHSYSFDGVLPEGHRYNITLPPLSPRGPTLTVRKHLEKNFTLHKLVGLGFISDKAAHFLQLAVEARLNIVISGGTGSGKTTFLNTLASLIPETQRVVSIEDTQELKPTHPNWIYLQTVKTEKARVTARDCLFNALRMRPDRIIVGECRSHEALDMLQAMNTGHDGSMTSIHANSAEDCLSRLENLVSLAHPEMPIKNIRERISDSVNLIVQLKRNSDGSRVVSEIIELSHMQGDVVTRSHIFKINSSGHLEPTGLVPNAVRKINSHEKKLQHSHFSTPSNSSLKKSS